MTNADLARIYGSDADAIYLAPIGTTLPTTINGALDEDFEDVGWIHSDGVKESISGSVEKKRGFQGNGVVRTRVQEGGSSLGFIALESKKQTRELRYDVKSSSSTAGVRTETRGSGQKVSARACVVDFFDADDTTVRERYIISRLEIAPDGDRDFSNSEIAGFGFVGEIIGDYTVLSTDLEAEEA